MSINCQNKPKNAQNCNCTYTGCSRKGLCCECLDYHRHNQEIPACFFPASAEKTYNRSINYFVSLHKK